MGWSKLKLMSLSPILLRVLLCLALAFNGTSSAFAAVHVSHEAGMQAEGAGQSPQVAAEMPCHDMDMTDSGSDLAGANENPAPVPDCCKEICQCVCMQGVASAIMPLSVVPVEYHVHPVVVRITAAYAPPVLPHLIRPPIG